MSKQIGILNLSEESNGQQDVETGILIFLAEVEVNEETRKRILELDIFFFNGEDRTLTHEKDDESPATDIYAGKCFFPEDLDEQSCSLGQHD